MLASVFLFLVCSLFSFTFLLSLDPVIFENPIIMLEAVTPYYHMVSGKLRTLFYYGYVPLVLYLGYNALPSHQRGYGVINLFIPHQPTAHEIALQNTMMQAQQLAEQIAE